ncbi:MAG: hypothetical protein ABSG46_20065 [Candidatus Binataceae bacterium]|jgi:hypothetical protein
MNFIKNNQLSDGHPVRFLEEGLLKALDYFFSLEDLPGIPDMKERFLNMRPGDGRTNETESQQASFWAEIRANYLLIGSLAQRF